jgi:ribonuclease HI
VWILRTDGASNDEGNEVGLILDGPDGIELTYALKLSFKSSKNEAEYEACIAGLRMAHKMGIRHLQVFMDFMLVVNHINQTYEAKEPSMIKYLQKAKEMMANFTSCEVFYVPRSQNKKADALSKLVLVSFSHLTKEIRVEVLQSPATESVEVCTVQFDNDSWMGPIHSYL